MGVTPQLCFVDFSIDVELEERFREFVALCGQNFALQLQDCEAITVAIDYQGFVKRFVTGFGAHDRPSVSERGVGFAPETLRKGELGSHLIFPKMTLDAFDGKVSALSVAEARNIIAHELAHADEHRRTALAFREEVLKLHAPGPDSLHVGRKAVWNEYYVCRTVASVNPGTLTLLEESLREMISEFGNACSTARSLVAAGQDLERVKGHLISVGIRFLMTAAQLLGHVDGLAIMPFQACPTLRSALMSERMEDIFLELHKALASLWTAYPSWSSFEDLQTIIKALHQRLAKV